jgi:serine/threonine protein kinase
MAFPLPDLHGWDGDSPPEALDIPVERPFCTFQTHTFNEVCPRNLKYDSVHPVYSTKSCQVYIACTLVDPPDYYALKESSFLRRIRSEYEIYQLVGRHPTIISCYDTWMQRGSAVLQLELAAKGSIRRELFSFSGDDIWPIFSHIISAIGNLHSKGIMHLDVSPANILQTVCGTGYVIYKLADFGTSLALGSFREECEGAGPYVSPEALAFPHTEYSVGFPTDIFSFGIVLYELITHKLAPRSGPGYQAIRDGTFDLREIPGELAFIPSMLDPNPGKRPRAADLLEIPRVKQELDEIGKNSAPKVVPVPDIMKTPVVPSHRLPPETPYAKRYGNQKGRKLLLDDELL